MSVEMRVEEPDQMCQGKSPQCSHDALGCVSSWEAMGRSRLPRRRSMGYPRTGLVFPLIAVAERGVRLT